MAEALIPFPLSSAPGRTPGEGAGRLVNVYTEALGQGATSPAVWRRAAGLTPFATVGSVLCRGFLEVNGLLFAVVGQTLYMITSAGAVTAVGTVTGSRRVFMERNNRTPTPDMVMVTENGAFVFTTAAVTAYPDADLPQPVSVAAQDGYFIFPIADGRCFASDLNSTAVNALSFATAESKPDGLVHAVPWSGYLLLMGAFSAEVWADTGNTPPSFPYSRSTTIARGLAAATAIAGYDNGFGAEDLIWVAEDNTVRRLRGTTPEKVSPPDLDHLVELVADKTVLEAMVYVSGGHAKWVLSSDTWTWEFDLTTEKWAERDSYGLPRWRATKSVWAFNKWLLGDTQSGVIYAADAAARREGADPLRGIIESGLVQNFPNGIMVARADFEFATGVGHAGGASANEVDPAVDISWSDDGGYTWSNPLRRNLGRQGKYGQRVSVTGCGKSGPRGRRWRLAVSDPVYVSITKAVQSSTLRVVPSG